VDRAALDAALALGGWCPRGRRAQDGPIAERYPLRETPARDYAQRTEWNVRDADATLIVACGKLSGGTRLTRDLALGYPRAVMSVCPRSSPDLAPVLAWLREHRIETLNVAGPREHADGGVYREAYGFLYRLFAVWGATA
jgi:hypothetical protein